jgi:glycerol kinase
VLDEGTTSTRAVLFDDRSGIVNDESRKLRVATPTSATVEQDATELADKSFEVLRVVVGVAQSGGI